MAESFPMKGGDGTYSYTKNSQYQKAASDAVKETVKEAIVESLDTRSLMSTSNTLRIVDLGCSVGPNTFFTMQDVIEAVETKCNFQGPSTKKLEFQVFFNDHVSNDFNTLFASLPPQRQYFAAGVPGSFYDQLFPSSSIHVAHSSQAMQWLSRLPEEILDEKSPAFNKGKIHYCGASDEVAKAYAAQFEKDMGNFLNKRAKELVPGGLIVLVMPGQPNDFHHSELPVGILFNFLGSSLMDMANEKIIDKAAIDAFNLPCYFPTPREMTSVVEKNGCFSIERMAMSNATSKINGQIHVPSLIMHLRAGMEGVFSKHFGSKTAEEMFNRASGKSEEISSWLESIYSKGTQLFAVLKRT